MRTLNRVFLMGFLGNDPTLQTSTKGKPYTQLNIATHRKYQTETGEWGEKTQWHRVHVFGTRAETCVRYLKKGRPVFVEGELQAYKWTDEAGRANKNFSVNAQAVEFFISPKNAESPP